MTASCPIPVTLSVEGHVSEVPLDTRYFLTSTHRSISSDSAGAPRAGTRPALVAVMTNRLTHLFLLLTVIGPLHMGEQLMTGIDEFYMIKGNVDAYYSWFAAANAGHASVVLITIVWTLVSILMWAVLTGGTARLAVLALFGLFGVQEVHHVFESLAKGAYDPGLVTCIPYAIAGGCLVAATWREYRTTRRAALQVALT